MTSQRHGKTGLCLFNSLSNSTLLRKRYSIGSFHILLFCKLTKDYIGSLLLRWLHVCK